MKIEDFLKYIFYKIVDFQPFLYRPLIEIFKYKFEIHKTDVDIWPSFPHMHSIENGLVLDIYTGKVYRKITKDCIGDAKEKDMKKLWNDTKFLSIVLEMRKSKPINVNELSKLPIEWLSKESLKLVKEHDECC